MALWAALPQRTADSRTADSATRGRQLPRPSCQQAECVTECVLLFSAGEL